MLLNRMYVALLNNLNSLAQDDNVSASYSNILVRKVTKCDICEL